MTPRYVIHAHNEDSTEGDTIELEAPSPTAAEALYRERAGTTAYPVIGVHKPTTRPRQ